MLQFKACTLSLLGVLVLLGKFYQELVPYCRHIVGDWV